MRSHTSPFIRETPEEKWLDGVDWGVAKGRQRERIERATESESHRSRWKERVSANVEEEKSEKAEVALQERRNA